MWWTGAGSNGGQTFRERLACVAGPLIPSTHQLGRLIFSPIGRLTRPCLALLPSRTLEHGESIRASVVRSKVCLRSRRCNPLRQGQRRHPQALEREFCRRAQGFYRTMGRGRLTIMIAKVKNSKNGAKMAIAYFFSVTVFDAWLASSNQTASMPQ